MTTRIVPYWACSCKKTNRHGFFYYISILFIVYNFFPISENLQNDEVVAFIFRSSEYQSTAS
jgi:hypothetical protein